MLNLICAVPLLINLTQYKWNNLDRINLMQAVKTCQVRYSKSPCLKRFIKADQQTYRALCGGRK